MDNLWKQDPIEVAVKAATDSVANIGTCSESLGSDDIKTMVKAVLKAAAPIIFARAQRRWVVSSELTLGKDLAEQLRVNVAAAIIQSGYLDQDDDDPNWWEIVDAKPCESCPSPENRRCACTGIPIVSDKLWEILIAVLAKVLNPDTTCTKCGGLWKDIDTNMNTRNKHLIECGGCTCLSGTKCEDHKGFGEDA